ncbi:MAG TPA: glucose 1-dehydrogenase [Methanoregulaceae archaeon]|nr:glucose 1-dehydrogenase [Methanoregulaceae archaeon]
MRAIIATPGTPGSARLEEILEPDPGAGQVRLETLYLGIDGTDREIDAGAYGAPPDGSSYLVLGHEAVCRVDGIGEGADGLARGDLVVPVVRRPCPENCLNCRAGEADRCITGHYREHGIFKLHGFASEYALSDAQYVVKIPPDLLDVAVLLEPLSIAENALSSIGTIQKRMAWEPSSAFVIGAGPLGLLAAFLLGERGYEVSVAATRDAESPKARLVREMGGTYYTVREHPLNSLGPQADLVIEASGNVGAAIDSLSLVRPNGIVCLLGIYPQHQACQEFGALLTSMVLNNHVLVGSVSSNRSYFERGVLDLQALKRRYGTLPDRLITSALDPEQFRDAFDPGGDEIKAVIRFGTKRG